MMNPPKPHPPVKQAVTVATPIKPVFVRSAHLTDKPFRGNPALLELRSSLTQGK